MVIETLKLADFRNFTLRELAFSSKNVFFLGPNGSGKSNLLESIAFLSLLRSFRTAPPREMIRIGEKMFSIEAEICAAYGKEILKVREHLSGRRELFMGDNPVRRSSEFIREFHAVVFSPEDRMIGSGSSGVRRRFFDILISTVEPEYLRKLSSYTRALYQRNKALKTAPQMAGYFDGELAAHAPFLAERRRFFAARMEEKVNELLGRRGELKIIYRTDTPASCDAFLELLESRRETERHRLCTAVGPQLDEFDLCFNGKLLRSFGSTGQIRLVTLLLKLAHFQMVRAGTPAPVTVLADDVTGELDEENLSLFLETVSSADQLFFTFAEAPRFTLPDSQQIAVGTREKTEKG